MRWRAARVDANHGAVVAALRAAGCLVLDLSAVGRGCPDLLVYHRRTGYFLVEVKDGAKVPSKRRLRATQVTFAALGWPVHTATSPEAALRACGLLMATP